MIGGRRQLKGRKSGDRRVRVERPHSPYFRYAGPGALVAREAASAPRTPTGRAVARVRQLVFGRPLANQEEIEERLSKKKALAIFSSDAISSRPTRPRRSCASSSLLAPAPCSCQWRWRSRSPSCWPSSRSRTARSVAPIQTAAARTSSRARTSRRLRLVAAAALLIDYVMTVAVSTAAAIAQIQSVIPAAYDVRIQIAFLSIALITVANLRGLRESGNIFAVPTYLFVGSGPRDRRRSARSGSRPARRRRSRPNPMLCRSAPRHSASCCC